MAQSMPDGLIDPTLVGDVLVILRGERSQRFVAKRAGIPTGTWCQWEKGKRMPRAGKREAILKALGVTKDEFDLALWKEMTRRLKNRGSESVGVERELTLFNRDLAKLGALELDELPEEMRAYFRRIRHTLEALCVQVSPLLAEYEALFLRLSQTTIKMRSE